MEQNAKNIDLQLDTVDVLTTGTAAEFVNGILDFLLFQRRQIPFVYKTYKYYVERWSDAEEFGNSEVQKSFSNYQLNQQRSKAKATKEAISDMREVSVVTILSIKNKAFTYLVPVFACSS